MSRLRGRVDTLQEPTGEGVEGTKLEKERSHRMRVLKRTQDRRGWQAEAFQSQSSCRDKDWEALSRKLRRLSLGFMKMVWQTSLVAGSRATCLIWPHDKHLPLDWWRTPLLHYPSPCHTFSIMVLHPCLHKMINSTSAWAPSWLGFPLSTSHVHSWDPFFLGTLFSYCKVGPFFPWDPFFLL